MSLLCSFESSRAMMTISSWWMVSSCFRKPACVLLSNALHSAYSYIAFVTKRVHSL